MEAHKNEGAKVEPRESHDSLRELERDSSAREAPHGSGQKADDDDQERVSALKEAKAKAEAKEHENRKLNAKSRKVKNNVRKLRMERMMSKAELARRAGVSTLTVDRVERGMSCRMDTKRKILEALGLKPQDRVSVFGDADED